MEEGITRRLNHLDDLPENIILEIFVYLSPKELLIIRRVCKKWKRVAADRSLWRKVDLRSFVLNVRSLGKLIRNQLSDSLTSIQIKGTLQYSADGTKGKASLDLKKSTISDAVLKDLKERCPHLKQFEMSHANLSSVNLASFPTAINTLILTNCLMPSGWFECLSNSDNPQFKFTHLDLTESRKLTDSDLSSICRNQLGLVILKLNGCYRLSGQGMKVMTDLKELLTLEMSHTRCDDLLVHHLCVANRKLQHLDLSFCAQVNDECLENIATLPYLKSLGLIGCKAISNDSISKLFTLNHRIFVKSEKTDLHG